MNLVIYMTHEHAYNSIRVFLHAQLDIKICKGINEMINVYVHSLKLNKQFELHRLTLLRFSQCFEHILFPTIRSTPLPMVLAWFNACKQRKVDALSEVAQEY